MKRLTLHNAESRLEKRRKNNNGEEYDLFKDESLNSLLVRSKRDWEAGEIIQRNGYKLIFTDIAFHVGTSRGEQFLSSLNIHLPFQRNPLQSTKELKLRKSYAPPIFCLFWILRVMHSCTTEVCSSVCLFVCLKVRVTRSVHEPVNKTLNAS